MPPKLLHIKSLYAKPGGNRPEDVFGLAECDGVQTTFHAGETIQMHVHIVLDISVWKIILTALQRRNLELRVTPNPTQPARHAHDHQHFHE